MNTAGSNPIGWLLFSEPTFCVSILRFYSNCNFTLDQLV